MPLVGFLDSMLAAPLGCLGCLHSVNVKPANRRITGLRSALLGRAEFWDIEKGSCPESATLRRDGWMPWGCWFTLPCSH